MANHFIASSFRLLLRYIVRYVSPRVLSRPILPNKPATRPSAGLMPQRRLTPRVLPSVIPLNYCPHCGADLSAGTDRHGLYERWFRPAFVVVGVATLAATMIVGCLALLLVLLAQAFPEDRSGLCDGCTVTFHNETDDRLCAFYPGCEEGGAQIKPHGKSEWLLDSCQGEPEVAIYIPSGRKIYSGVAGCYEWDDAFVLINQRGGEFVVADSLNAQPKPTLRP